MRTRSRALLRAFEQARECALLRWGACCSCRSARVLSHSAAAGWGEEWAGVVAAEWAGGRGAGGGGGAESPSKRIKSDFEDSDPVQFLLRRDKALKLDNTQKDSLKALHKELDAMEKPMFADVEKLFSDAEKNRKDAADGGEQPAAGGRGGRIMPDGVRELVAKLSDTQLAFKDRARAHLNDGQRHIADSLKVIYDTELQEKQAKQRTSRGGMGGDGGGGGMGRGRGRGQ